MNVKQVTGDFFSYLFGIFQLINIDNQKKYDNILDPIILLSDFLTNGYCYDRALLASRAFLDDENVDVSLLYVSINSLRLNPKYVDNKDPMNSDHCVVEITFDTGKSFIIDTSVGFIYEKSLFFHQNISK